MRFRLLIFGSFLLLLLNVWPAQPEPLKRMGTLLNHFDKMFQHEYHQHHRKYYAHRMRKRNQNEEQLSIENNVNMYNLGKIRDETITDVFFEINQLENEFNKTTYSRGKNRRYDESNKSKYEKRGNNNSNYYYEEGPELNYGERDQTEFEQRRKAEYEQRANRKYKQGAKAKFDRLRSKVENERRQKIEYEQRNETKYALRKKAELDQQKRIKSERRKMDDLEQREKKAFERRKKTEYEQRQKIKYEAQKRTELEQRLKAEFEKRKKEDQRKKAENKQRNKIKYAQKFNKKYEEASTENNEQREKAEFKQEKLTEYERGNQTNYDQKANKKYEQEAKPENYEQGEKAEFEERKKAEYEQRFQNGYEVRDKTKYEKRLNSKHQPNLHLGTVNGRQWWDKFPKINEDRAKFEYVSKMINKSQEVYGQKWADKRPKLHEDHLPKIERLSKKKPIELFTRVNQSEVVLHDGNKWGRPQRPKKLEKRPNFENIFKKINTPEYEEMREIEDYYLEEPNAIWEVTSVTKVLSKRGTAVKHRLFPLRDYMGLGVRAELSLYNDHELEMSLSYKNLVRSQEPLAMVTNNVIFPRVYLTLRDRSGNSQAQDLIGSTTRSFRQLNLEHITLRYLDLSLVRSLAYVAEDVMEIALHVEPPEVAHSIYSYDGNLSWAMRHYEEKKEMALRELLLSCESPYFYTSPKGYRVQAGLFLNGYFGNGILSVRVDFLAGRNDDRLKDSFPHRTIVAIVDPFRPSRNAIVKSGEFNIDQSPYYYIDIGSLEEIEKLLFDDALYYKVSIQALPT